MRTAQVHWTRLRKAAYTALGETTGVKVMTVTGEGKTKYDDYFAQWARIYQIPGPLWKLVLPLYTTPWISGKVKRDGTLVPPKKRKETSRRMTTKKKKEAAGELEKDLCVLSSPAWSHSWWRFENMTQQQALLKHWHKHQYDADGFKNYCNLVWQVQRLTTFIHRKSMFAFGVSFHSRRVRGPLPTRRQPHSA